MKSAKFTFIEVLIAALILALSTVIAVEMSARAHLQTFDIEDQWAREHLLSLGCEYYLLYGHEADFPQELLPEGFSLECELNSSFLPENADEEKFDSINGWVLGEYTIKLFRNGDEINTISIDKLVPGDYL